MSELKVINVVRLVGSPSFAGVAAGRAALAALRSALPLDDADPSDSVLLDFVGVKLITASAFREAILPIVFWATQKGRPCLLVNVNTVIKEEACIAAEHLGIALVFAKFDTKGISEAAAAGVLEEKHALALRIVLEAGEADAKAVKEVSGENTVTTVWNNRLVTLHKMGLLKVRKVGKTKFYSPIVKGMSYGTGFPV